VKIFAFTVGTALISGWGLLSSDPRLEPADASIAALSNAVSAAPGGNSLDHDGAPIDAVCVAPREPGSTANTVDAELPCGQGLDGITSTARRHAASF